MPRACPRAVPRFPSVAVPVRAPESTEGWSDRSRVAPGPRSTADRLCGRVAPLSPTTRITNTHVRAIGQQSRPISPPQASRYALTAARCRGRWWRSLRGLPDGLPPTHPSLLASGAALANRRGQASRTRCTRNQGEQSAPTECRHAFGGGHSVVTENDPRAAKCPYFPVAPRRSPHGSDRSVPSRAASLPWLAATRAEAFPLDRAL